MHEIEPYFNWRLLYTAEEDAKSPFYGKEHDEFNFSNKIYNYFIHPQWDEFGSSTLYLKIIYTDYTQNFCIIEFIGEWNDAVNNDVMWLKRDVIEMMLQEGIDKYILIGENILNFHSSDDCYYQEWFEEVGDGWVAAINFKQHVLDEFRTANIDYYINFGGELDEMHWRPMTPQQLFTNISAILQKRLG
jgi:hypothetical protein